MFVFNGPSYISNLVPSGTEVGYLGSNSIPSPYSSYATRFLILAKCGLIEIIPSLPVFSGFINTK